MSVSRTTRRHSRRPGTREAKGHEAPRPADVQTQRELPSWAHGGALGVLVLLVGGVYLSTMLAGVDAGDSAELQYRSVLLGSCHPPGYHIELLLGKAFTLLPVGPGPAWRMNFMMAVAGLSGVLALYGVVRRATGQVLAALVAALTLAFSSVYWFHSLVAEAYVFYAAFLAGGVYTAVRFVQSNRAGWLYATAVLVGVCVADRASELFVMGAFVGLWLGFRRQVRLSWLRLAVAVVLFVAPFVLTVGYHVVRHNKTALRDRDDTLRRLILAGRTEEPPEYEDVALSEKLNWPMLRHTIRYSLGLTYTQDAEFSGEVMRRDLDKYAWLLSGQGVFGQRYKGTTARAKQLNNVQGSGASITLGGLVLAVLGIVFRRRQWGWALVGVGLFAGNLAFYLWHHRWDNLTFTIPGLLGLAVLMGLGVAGPVRAVSGVSGRRLAWQGMCLLVPLFLLVGNYRYMDRSTATEQERQERMSAIAAAPFPQGSAIITSCWPAMTYRYVLYIEGGRRDMYVLYHDDTRNWQRFQEYFNQLGRPVFLEANRIAVGQRRALLARTPREYAELGFVMVGGKSKSVP